MSVHSSSFPSMSALMTSTVVQPSPSPSPTSPSVNSVDSEAVITSTDTKSDHPNDSGQTRLTGIVQTTPDEFVHVDSAVDLPLSSSYSVGGATGVNGGDTPSRKWSFTSLMTTIQSATMKKATLGSWFTRTVNTLTSTDTDVDATNDSGNDSDNEAMTSIIDNGGMEEQIDQSLLMVDGLYSVQHLDLSYEQQRNYRFVNKRYQFQREQWFSQYCLDTIVKQHQRWHCRDYRELSHKQVKKLARIGIPAMMRPNVWAHALKLDTVKSDNVGKYQALLRAGQSLPCVKMIEKDLDRTFINHPAFHLSPMLTSLRSVLIAFAQHHPNILYCQSLNFFAGFLLLFFNEEDSFWLMTIIINLLLPSDYFTDSMLGIHSDLNVLHRLLEIYLPSLHAHLTGMRVDVRPIAFPWFLSLFIKTLPIETVLRVWDCFVFEGGKCLFLVALALLKLNEKKILKIHDFGKLYHFISTMGNTMFDCDTIIATALTFMGISRKLIRELRREEEKVLESELKALEARRQANGSANDSGDAGHCTITDASVDDSSESEEDDSDEVPASAGSASGSLNSSSSSTVLG